MKKFIPLKLILALLFVLLSSSLTYAIIYYPQTYAPTGEIYFVPPSISFEKEYIYPTGIYPNQRPRCQDGSQAYPIGGTGLYCF